MAENMELPPVHGPGTAPELPTVAEAVRMHDDYAARCRQAVLRAGKAQRAARDAAALLQLLPPAGTLHA